MAARTCLLCGKSLGRIRGAGEEFCSREHRNQYRLRRGMERLAEANQVASVIRRRESPRQIPTEQLRAGGDTSPRSFAAPQRANLEIRTPQLWPAPPALPRCTEAIRPLADFDAQPAVLRGPSLVASAAAPALPRPAPALYAHVAAAPPLRQRTVLADTPVEARTASSGKPAAQPRPLPRSTIRKSGMDSAAARHIARPSAGRALRVSLSAGFRAPAGKLRAAAATGPKIPGMTWPGLRHLPAAAAADASPRSAVIAIEQQALRIPAPLPEIAVRFGWPGALQVPIQFVDAANAPRSAFVPIGSPEERR